MTWQILNNVIFTSWNSRSPSVEVSHLLTHWFSLSFFFINSRSNDEERFSYEDKKNWAFFPSLVSHVKKSRCLYMMPTDPIRCENRDEKFIYMNAFFMEHPMTPQWVMKKKSSLFVTTSKCPLCRSFEDLMSSLSVISSPFSYLSL